MAAYGYLAPPKDPKAPALAVGIWMGNSDNSPNDGKLSLDTSAPLWSAILTEISKGTPIADFKPPAGLKTATVDAFTGLKPGPFTTKTVKELFITSTVPTQRETAGSWRADRQGDRPPLAGRLRRTEGHRRLLRHLRGRGRVIPTWQKADRNWAARAARGAGVRGTSKGTRTAYFYGTGFFPFGRSLGRAVRAEQALPARARRAAARSAPAARSDPCPGLPPEPEREPRRRPKP